MTTTDATVLSLHNSVATITLNRPDNRNALSIELVASLGRHLEEAIADPAVHVIVLTGAGSTFCAGADLKERRTVTAGAENGELPEFVKVFRLIKSAPKVVIGRINGHALAGGLGLAACCDISVASAKATFGFTEVRIGVTPAVISVVCLPKMRVADATELFLTGERISAERAAAVGLITRAVPDETLDAAIDEVVGKVLLGGPAALGGCKQLLRTVPEFADEETAFRWTSALSAAFFASDEGAEGMRAFAEKRSPAWVRPR